MTDHQSVIRKVVTTKESYAGWPAHGWWRKLHAVTRNGEVTAAPVPVLQINLRNILGKKLGGHTREISLNPEQFSAGLVGPFIGAKRGLRQQAIDAAAAELTDFRSRVS